MCTLGLRSLSDVEFHHLMREEYTNVMGESERRQSFSEPCKIRHNFFTFIGTHKNQCSVTQTFK